MNNKPRFREVEFMGFVCWIRLNDRQIYRPVGKTWFIARKKKVGLYWSIVRVYNFKGDE